MLIITNANKLFSIDEKGKNFLEKLTVKDRVLILTEKDASMPVALYNVFSNLKAKLEFVEAVYKDEFSEGYTYGILASQAKGGEQVIILSDNTGVDGLANVKWQKTLDFAIKKTVTTRSTRKKAESEATGPEKNNVAEKRKTAKKETSAEEDFMPAPISEMVAAVCSYPKLSSYKKLLESNGATLEKCIREASDAEIGLKIMLETRFGKQEGGLIWSVIHEDFDKLRIL